MLKNKNIIYFSNDWRTDHKTSSHHIARELLKENKILYIETGGMRKPQASGRDIKRIFSRLILWLKGVRKLEKNLYIYSLIIFPSHNRLARALNTYLNVFMIRFACIKYKFNQPILWFVAPHIAYFLDYLPKNLVVYYCTDKVSQMPGVNIAAIEAMEDKLLKQANLVFATAQHLLDRLNEKNLNKNIFYSPHAVDYQHFAKAQDKPLTLAQELKELRHPIIGYVGLLERWIDIELIGYIAKQRPNWSVVLIGRVAVNIDELKKENNIYFLGVKPYEQLPNYMKNFDVCISPFRINELTKSVNPIKLKEYLASGKPIVSSGLPEIEKFKDMVEIADSYEEFVNKIQDVLINDNQEKIRIRMEFVSQDSWPNRVEKISQIIEDSLLREEAVYAAKDN